MAFFDAPSIIASKRDGNALEAQQIDWMLRGFTEGRVSAEQMSALAMAIYFQGLNRDELATWTQCMVASGRTLRFDELSRPTVDKHSTGGVGDKITLPLTPLVASYGAAVPQMAGRGLGHTGGTLDKLEAIPGWSPNLSHERLLNQLIDVGAVICAAGDDVATTDRLLYALRDVTATVESIPLIASSIMSKKIAEGTKALVLDVKVGSGAFMKNQADAELLAERMIELGEGAGIRTRAVLTNMSTPLGLTAGNAIEVRESMEVLSGGGPEDVVALTVELARHMLELVGRPDIDPRDNLGNGRAMDTWRRMIRAQGGDPAAPLPEPTVSHTIASDRSGYLDRMDAHAVGIAAWRLGAGRSRKEDAVDMAAGVRWHARPGDWVEPGAELFTLYATDESKLPAAIAALDASYGLSDVRPDEEALVLGVLG